jgi:hypothetical protein
MEKDVTITSADTSYATVQRFTSAHIRGEIMGRILKSLEVILVVVVLMGTVTLVSFANARAHTNIMPDAGKTSLNIIGDGSQVFIFQVGDVAPGASGFGRKRVINVGNRVGTLDVRFSQVKNTPGTFGKVPDGNGDLGAHTEIAVYMDSDTSCDWSNGDVGLKSDGAIYNYPASLDYIALDNYGGNSWNQIDSVATSAAFCFTIAWRIPDTVGNEIQGNSVSFDVTFILEDVSH